jgi:signal transduction histidine kinase
VVLAGCIVAAGQVVAWTGWIGEQPQHGPAWENAIVSAVALATVAWHRVAPVAAVVGYTTVFCLVQPLAPHDLPVWTGFVPLVALTVNAGYRTELRPALASLLVAMTGLTVLTTVEPVLQSWDTYIFNAALVVPAWLAARSLAGRNRRAVALSASLADLAAAQAERERVAVEEERARIARELHDVVAHSVTVLLIQVGSARMLLEEPSGPVAEQLRSAERSGREALAELRRLLQVLRPARTGVAALVSTEPQPGLEDLDRLVATFRAAGTDVRISVEGGRDEVGPGLGLTVYRIVQEALTNAVRHAPGSTVEVRVAVRGEEVAVQVQNGGQATGGPATAAPSYDAAGAGTGLGLVGIRERVSVFGGRLAAGPDGDGWTISASLPRPGPAGESQGDR